jgi:galactokinase
MSKYPIRADIFQVYRRASHVFSEALRVLRFAQICNGEEQIEGDPYLALGQLLNESQKSCRDLFDCSCPELDQLTELAR